MQLETLFGSVRRSSVLFVCLLFVFVNQMKQAEGETLLISAYLGRMTACRPCCVQTQDPGLAFEAWSPAHSRPCCEAVNLQT